MKKLQSRKTNLFICHRDYFKNFLYRKGGGDNLATKLFRSNLVSLEISHGSFSNRNYFSIFIIDKRFRNKILFFKKISNNFRILKYIIIIFYLFKVIRSNNLRFSNSLCIDPVSSLIGIILKKKINNHVIFHVTDYAEKRFGGIFLNSIYQLIFFISLRYSDFVTSPSMKLIKKFKNNINYIPNTPDIKKLSKKTVKKNYILMLIPKIDEGINMNIIIECAELLKKNKKKVFFLITGQFVSKKIENIIKSYLKNKNIYNYVKFVGYVEKRRKIYKLLDESLAGITSYYKTSKHNYYKYSDSLKIRQYAEFSLPILTEGYTPLSALVVKNNFGFIFKNSKDLYKKILKLKSKKNYNILSGNAKKWSTINDGDFFIKKFKKKIR